MLFVFRINRGSTQAKSGGSASVRSLLSFGKEETLYNVCVSVFLTLRNSWLYAAIHLKTGSMTEFAFTFVWPF